MEPFGAHIRPIRLAQQLGELAPELGAQLGTRLLLDDELGQDPVDQRRGVDRRGRRELRQEDLSHGGPELPVVQGAVVGRLAHQAPGRTRPLLIASPTT